MYVRLDRVHRTLPVVLGVVTLLAVGLLVAWDVRPSYFPARPHEFLAALPLAMIAFAYLVYQTDHRPPVREMVKAILLAVAFLFWAANQFWPASPQATLFNDLAIALFVLDVFVVMAAPWQPRQTNHSPRLIPIQASRGRGAGGAPDEAHKNQ